MDDLMFVLPGRISIDPLANDQFGGDARITSLAQPDIGSVEFGVDGGVVVTVPPGTRQVSFGYTAETLDGRLTDGATVTLAIAADVVTDNEIAAAEGQVEPEPSFLGVRVPPILLALLEVNLPLLPMGTATASAIFFFPFVLIWQSRRRFVAVDQTERTDSRDARSADSRFSFRHDATVLWLTGRKRDANAAEAEVEVEVETPNGHAWIRNDAVTPQPMAWRERLADAWSRRSRGPDQ